MVNKDANTLERTRATQAIKVRSNKRLFIDDPTIHETVGVARDMSRIWLRWHASWASMRLYDCYYWLRVSVASVTSHKGVRVSHARRLILGLVSLLVLLGVSVSCSSGKSSSGVAQIDESQALENPADSAVHSNPSAPSTSGAGTSDQNTDNSELTDEEIASLFTACMRDHRINSPDPELNADGTINWEALKGGMAQDPKYATRSKEAFEDCLPLLEGITRAEETSPEDETELQDNLLRYAECLREGGLDVPDPDFSGDDKRAGMKTMGQDIKGADSRVQQIEAECTESIFGGGGGGKKIGK